MRATTLFVFAGAAALGGAVASPARGGEGVTGWMEVGTAELGALDSFAVEIDLTGSPFRVVGFEIRFDYVEPIADSSWASDLQVAVSAPSGNNYIVGGLSNQPQADELWSFDGQGSDLPGHYGDSGADIFIAWDMEPEIAGDFEVRLINDWSSDPNANVYDMVQIRFYTVPLILCLGDIDLDETVGFADLLLLLNAWGVCHDCPEDLDDDGVVGFEDLLVLLFAWGPCP